jgi:hypothetical protein
MLYDTRLKFEVFSSENFDAQWMNPTGRVAMGSRGYIKEEVAVNRCKIACIQASGSEETLHDPCSLTR